MNCFESVNVADLKHRPNYSIVVNNVNSDDKKVQWRKQDRISSDKLKG
jgi:hypothetical protein